MNQTPASTVQDWRDRAAALAINGQAFIDGRYVAAASGETFDDITPIDGRVIARVASTDKADVERAVAAARRAFDSGVWSTAAAARTQTRAAAVCRTDPRASGRTGAARDAGHG